LARAATAQPSLIVAALYKEITPSLEALRQLAAASEEHQEVTGLSHQRAMAAMAVAREVDASMAVPELQRLRQHRGMRAEPAFRLRPVAAAVPVAVRQLSELMVLEQPEVTAALAQQAAFPARPLHMQVAAAAVSLAETPAVPVVLEVAGQRRLMLIRRAQME
jgi:hypothetical protein